MRIYEAGKQNVPRQIYSLGPRIPGRVSPDRFDAFAGNEEVLNGRKVGIAIVPINTGTGKQGIASNFMLNFTVAAR